MSETTGMLFLATAVYMLPTFVAYSRRHHNALSISLLNLLLGFTVVGWAVALSWANKKQPA
jgi:hypothetical protein